MIKLKHILLESTINDLKKIEQNVKKQIGTIDVSYEKNPKKRGPRSYEKNHPILIFNKGKKGNQISITIGGDYEIEYGWEVTGPGFEFHSFKSHDIDGIVKYVAKKIK